MVQLANDENNWNFSLKEFEPLQYTIYNIGDHYDWHIDSHKKPYNNGLIRKLSFTLCLNDDYEGGDFRICQPHPNPDKVIIETKFGNITLRLYKDTPIHRANFIFLTKIEYFNTTEFYRVAKGFVIQGGNSDEYEMIKKRMKYDNYLLRPEFRNNRKHKYGALAAAREWDNNPDKLSSPFQFYIVTKKDGAHHLDGAHTVFGEVISGFEAIHKMEQVKVDPGQWPIQNVNMTVKIVK